MEVLEALLVQPDRIEQQRALRRPETVLRTTRRDVALREVLEPVDHAGDHREEDDRRDHRQRDVPEALPPARSLEVGGLVELCGNVEERRKEDDHDLPYAP